MKNIILGLFIATITATGFLAAFHIGLASAQGSDGSAAIGSVTAPALGSGSATTPPSAPALHDPLATPAAAYDDLKMAKKTGWGLAALAALVMLGKLLSRLGGVFTFLSKGKAALFVAAVGAFALTAYNAIALGGSWVAAMMSAFMAFAAAWDSTAKPPATSAAT